MSFAVGLEEKNIPTISPKIKMSHRLLHNIILPRLLLLNSSPHHEKDFHTYAMISQLCGIKMSKSIKNEVL